MRVLVSSDNVITSPTFTGADEDAADCDEVPTCSVSDWSGADLGDAEVEHVGDEDSGSYRATLTADDHCSVLDRLTVTWAGVVDGLARTYTEEVKVVGGLILSVPALRASFTDGASFSAAQIAQWRDEFADEFEDYRGVPAVPELGVDSITSSDGRHLVVYKLRVSALRAVVLDGTALDVDDLTLTNGNVTRAGGWPCSSSATVAFEWGFPAAVRLAQSACAFYVAKRAKLDASGSSRDARWQMNEGMTTGFTKPDADHPTGWTDVDFLLNQIPDHRLPGVG